MFASLALYCALLLSGCEDSKTCELPVVHIYSDEIRADKKAPCLFEYTDCRNSFSLHARIKSRGNSSSHFAKTSYTLKLPEHQSLANLPADNDWILNASYIDKTFMRHKLNFDLFRAMSPKNIAPRCDYVELYENDHYMGLYVLMERMDATRLGVDKNDPHSFVFKEPPILYDHTGSWSRDSLLKAAQKFPNHRREDRGNFLRKLDTLIRFADDQTFSTHIFRYLNIENMIDWQLSLLLANNSDGQHKNYFIYRTDSLSAARIAIWDCDHGLGRDGDNELNMLHRPIDPMRMTLFKRLLTLNPEQFSERMAMRWAELRQNLFTLHYFEQEMSHIHQEIGPYTEKNAELWPYNGEGYYDDNDYDQEVEIIREFLRIQIARLDAHFEYHP